MNIPKKLRFGLLAVAIALVAVSVPANAQQIYRATFTLPFEAQWGKTVMEPGEYTITVEQALGQKLIRLHGAGEVAVFAGISNTEPVGDNGKLTFVNVNGLYNLKSFSASAIGQAFEFPVHKARGDRAEVTTLRLGVN